MVSSSSSDAQYSIGDILRDHLRKAVVEREKYQQLFDDFTGELAAEKIDEWIQAVVSWETDFSQDDPYYMVPSGKYSDFCHLRCSL